MESERTFDYSIFKTITSNREIDERHVNSLIKAIRTKNLLRINPIIVNSNFEVIDGQHRLEAVKKIGGIYIYYIVDPDVTKADIASINSHAKNWQVIDYINYWSVEKKPGFDLLSKFLYENPLIPTTTVLLLLSANGNRDTNGLKNGAVDVSNYDNACKIATILKFYRNIIDFAYERSFVNAVMHLFYLPGYNHDLMKQKLEFQSRSLVKCINKKQYIDLLLEIYNYKNQKNQLKG